MYVSFGKKFEDYFSEVLTSIKGKSSIQQYQQQLPSNILNETKLFHLTNKNSPTRLSHQYTPQKQYSKSYNQLKTTFTNFRNGRYIIGNKSIITNSFHIHNIGFPGCSQTHKRKNISPVKQPNHAMSEHKPMIMDRPRLHRYQIQMKESKIGKQIDMSNIQIKDKAIGKLQQKMKQKLVKKAKKTQNLQGWASGNQDEDFVQYFK